MNLMKYVPPRGLATATSLDNNTSSFLCQYFSKKSLAALYKMNPTIVANIEEQKDVEVPYITLSVVPKNND